jgi:cyclopropane fatty-acyl-phospholipid synthase-like methyltransferase
MENLTLHWNKVFTDTNNIHTWTQSNPETTLNLIKSLNLKKNAAIIDIGGGDSKLVDHLLDLGYTNITVLDISSNALDISRKRLGERSKKVRWIVSDITQFKTDEQYDVWIDRAAFHFLREDEQIKYYTNLTKHYVSENGYLLISTFSNHGPNKCSGLDVKQYNKEDLTKLFEDNYNRERCIFEDHITPSKATQNFIYCLFKHRLGAGVLHNQSEDEYKKHEGEIKEVDIDSCDITKKGFCCG